MWKATRLLLLLGAVLAAALLACYGTDLLDALRFKRELDRYQADRTGSGKCAHDLAQTCGLCHGLNGNSRNGHYPSLAGQPAAYLADQLSAFAGNQRLAPQMQPLAAQLTVTEREQIANYYASLPAEASLHTGGDAIRSCTACHGDRLQGMDKPLPIPRLAGQGREYVIAQLQAYRNGERIDPSGSMSAIAGALDDAAIQAIALAIAGKAEAGQ